MNANKHDRATNNIHRKFPPMVSDGNHYTDWSTACTNNEILKNSAGITDNYDYRQWLTNNANKVMKQNRITAYSDCGIPYNSFDAVAESSKYIFRNCNDKTMPHGYETSDLKNIYLSKQELQERLSAPIMNQDELLKYGIGNHF